MPIGFSSASTTVPLAETWSTSFLVVFPVAMIVLALVIIGFIALLKRYPLLQALLAVPGFCVVLWVVIGSACDRAPSVNTTASTPSPAPPQPPPPPAQEQVEETPHQKYAKKVESLLTPLTFLQDPLYFMKLDVDDYNRQTTLLKAKKDSLDAALTLDEKVYPSWRALTDAVWCHEKSGEAFHKAVEPFPAHYEIKYSPRPPGSQNAIQYLLKQGEWLAKQDKAGGERYDLWKEAGQHTDKARDLLREGK